MHTQTMLAIATSHWSQAHRTALVLIGTGSAIGWEDMVPRVWNRKAKALAGLRELKEEGHVLFTENGLALVETSFGPPIDTARPTQKLLPQEPGLNDALAEVSAVVPAPSCPGQDSPVRPGTDASVLSWTGQESSEATAARCAPSWSGPPRSSNRSINNFDRFDDRGKRGNPEDEHHVAAIHELLAKHPKLADFRGEFLRKKTGTAAAFALLMEHKPARARALLRKAAGKDKPGAFLNRSLHNEATQP